MLGRRGCLARVGGSDDLDLSGLVPQRDCERIAGGEKRRTSNGDHGVKRLKSVSSSRCPPGGIVPWIECSPRYFHERLGRSHFKRDLEGGATVGEGCAGSRCPPSQDHSEPSPPLACSLCQFEGRTTGAARPAERVSHIRGG